MINKYLVKHSFLAPQISSAPVNGLNMVIVIPARAEPDLIPTLESLVHADACKKPFEVIIVFNHPEDEKEELKEQNRNYLNQCEEWIAQKKYDNYHIIKAFDLPKKHAGVGLARKIGMDEAVYRFGDHNGIIVALDADCVVKKNYLSAIEKAFDENTNHKAASLYFEHSLDDLDQALQNGIIQYELHLRYYNQLLRYAGHPFAFHTVGSSMAVRSDVYQSQGGMNKRKAGEDFYFLQKIIQAGGFFEINSTCVYPSARISDRVPFGTGRAQGEWLSKNKKHLMSYHPQIGGELKSFFHLFESAYLNGLNLKEIPASIVRFLGKETVEEKYKELQSNTASEKQFISRFYQWFNLFMCFKFAHFYRDNFKENIPISEGAYFLLKKIDEKVHLNLAPIALLEEYRKMDRNFF